MQMLNHGALFLLHVDQCMLTVGWSAFLAAVVFFVAAAATMLYVADFFFV